MESLSLAFLERRPWLVDCLLSTENISMKLVRTIPEWTFGAEKIWKCHFALVSFYHTCSALHDGFNPSTGHDSYVRPFYIALQINCRQRG